MHPTLLACLQELRKRLEEDHDGCAEAVATNAKAAADAPDVMQAMMLLQQAKNRAQAAQDRAKAAQDQAKASNKVALQAEKKNEGWNQRELEHMLPLPMMVRTVRSKHGTKRYIRTDKVRMRHI